MNDPAGFTRSFIEARVRGEAKKELAYVTLVSTTSRLQNTTSDETFSETRTRALHDLVVVVDRMDQKILF